MGVDVGVVDERAKAKAEWVPGAGMKPGPRERRVEVVGSSSLVRSMSGATY